MKPDLNNFLICPICRQKLSLKILKSISDEIIEGKLTCTKKHIFKISNGIPRFVKDPSKDFQKTEDAFYQNGKIITKHIMIKNGLISKKNGFLIDLGGKIFPNLKIFLKNLTIF